MIRVYGELGQDWLERYRRRSPIFACILGFTATGLIPGISAAGATPEDRYYTAIADGEFLYNGITTNPQYPLPSLTAGASPTLISRAVIESLNIPLYLFNAGLPIPTAVPTIDLFGIPAACLTTGKALPIATVKQLFQQGLIWGQKLGSTVGDGYLMIGECVVGGTTTALSILTGLGIAALGKVNSSHPTCNHAQKWEVVQRGLALSKGDRQTPFELVAAVGDPMQIAAAGMALGASQRGGVMLAGGTQMLAVYALARAIAVHFSYPWQPSQIVVGTTRWVADDFTGDTVGLAATVGVPLLATQLSFATSPYPQLQAYEQGYVKEGVGAGGCAITSHLSGWTQFHLQQAIENLFCRYSAVLSNE